MKIVQKKNMNILVTAAIPSTKHCVKTHSMPNAENAFNAGCSCVGQNKTKKKRTYKLDILHQLKQADCLF